MAGLYFFCEWWLCGLDIKWEIKMKKCSFLPFVFDFVIGVIKRDVASSKTRKRKLMQVTENDIDV